jgi:IMP dehydrogenase/GMP reductase
LIAAQTGRQNKQVDNDTGSLMITSTSEIRTGLSYDDVLLVPQRTSAKSRGLVDVSSQLTRNIRIQRPIVSSNVDFCTGAAMAVSMSLFGGIGFLHRVNTIETAVEDVRIVKAAPVSNAAYPNATVDAAGRLRVGASIGIINDYKERAARLVEAGADLLVVDVAHGHADGVIETVAYLKQRYAGIEVVAGNVATRDGTRDLIAAGADAVKVGIGPGGVCTTRLVAGAGVPQITAIIDCAQEAHRHNIPVIADGGIRQPGDVAKALACGASTVMLGSALAGSEESCAILIEDGGRKYKVTTGEASLGMKLMLKKRNAEPISQRDIDHYVPEGIEATYPYSGPVETTLLRFVGGLRSGMSYSGAMSIAELWQKAELCRVTPLGQAESQPHAVVGAEVRQLAPDYRTMAAE